MFQSQCNKIKIPGLKRPGILCFEKIGEPRFIEPG
jgi:hypothetical protein